LTKMPSRLGFVLSIRKGTSVVVLQEYVKPLWGLGFNRKLCFSLKYFHR